ncbi:MAG: class I SAM-dependent methyltransferase [Verrucomicrobia bacterium]|nr:class I SAM-dependent methyltransferase [Verrucomicrobiota bacterium]MBV9671906.1 class I SAM-dependent methyltransferase [Verrucomicrobiota bacterium]
MNTNSELTHRGSAILELLLADYHPRDFTIQLWDGSQIGAEGDFSRFNLRFNSPEALRLMLSRKSSDLALAEAYIYGSLDVQGDHEAAMRLANFLANRRLGASTILQVGWNALHIPRGSNNGRHAVRLRGKAHTVARDRQAVRFHYDVTNEFYALWLDSRMVYSCAYFKQVDDDLDTAQVQKLDYLCRKLRLKPGERLLDIGCGWGGLVIFAAQNYGVSCKGITLSENQATLANQRIAQAGLQKRCQVQVCDYRELSEQGEFEKIVSVGMVEHVGRDQLRRYFGQAMSLLLPGGVFLNHGIACRAGDESKTSAFISRYVFPDGELLPINETLRYAEEVGFEVRDVENLREHYTLTLREWARRLDLNRSRAVEVVDEPTFRVWRLFLPGSAIAFDSGALNVYQTLLVKTAEGSRGLPLTRSDWYLEKRSA